jgi:hypothetical protein
MNLLRTYSKIIFVRNRLNYLRIACSIILAYAMISFMVIYIYSMLSLNSKGTSELRYTCISILTILLIAVMTLVIYQLYMVMKVGMKDYRILRGLGATNYSISLLNIVHVVILIIISVPVGLFCGYFLTSYLLRFMDRLVPNHIILERITSVSTLSIIAVVICFFIIVIGIHFDRYIRRTPLTNILSEIATASEDV